MNSGMRCEQWLTVTDGSARVEAQCALDEGHDDGCEPDEEEL